MALMKTGRKPNGEDPKKPKGEVTAKKPVEPPQKQYTLDDYYKNEEIKSRNKAAKEKYESDLASYNKAMKAYSEQPKGRKDMTTLFQGGGRYLNPTELEAWNKEAETSGRSETMGGLKAKKVYVTKDYGKEGSISTLKTATGKSYSGGLGAFHEWMEEPKKPIQGPYEKELNIDITKLPREPLQKLPLKPVQKIDQGKGKLMTRSYEQTPAEKPDWEAPSKTETKFKTRYKGASNANTFERGPLKSARVVDLKRSSSKEVKVKGYNKEAKMAKAYFSGYEGKSKFDIEGTSEERGAIGTLKADKADLKSGIKEARKAGDREKVQGYRAAKKDVKSEIKQAKLASKYLSKLGQEDIGVVGGQNLYRTRDIKTFTPAAMAGFTGSKQDTYNSDANFNKFLAKRSTDNPANRNTITAQEKALSFKERTAQRKADRAQRKADTKLQQSIKIPN